jgi:Flp pilus assembly pilin Flp
MTHREHEGMSTLSLYRRTRGRDCEDGQDVLEYALLASLIAILAIGAMSTIGNTIKTVYWDVIASAF